MPTWIVTFVLQLLPMLVQLLPELAADFEAIVSLVKSGATDLTAEQQATIDAALDKAHTLLQSM